MHSDWVRHELEIAAAVTDRLIIPVILHERLDLPPALAVRQWLKFTGRPTRKQIATAAAQIADVTESYLKATPSPVAAVSAAKAPALATDIAQEIRAAIEPVSAET